MITVCCLATFGGGMLVAYYEGVTFWNALARSGDTVSRIARDLLACGFHVLLGFSAMVTAIYAFASAWMR